MILINSVHCAAQEICNNGKDDDGNGLIDLFDPACQCHFTVTDNILLNGSFESHNHCPASYTYDQEYNIADYWQYGTYTNLNEAYFYHNTQCSYDSGLVASKLPPALPLPQGSGFISIYNSSYVNAVPENTIPKSYVGQCLQTTLKKGEDYTLSFYAGRFKSWDDIKGEIFPFTVAVFGNADCAAAPFGVSNVYGNGCPANYPGWVLLGKVKVYSSDKWVQNKIRFTTPSDINIIEMGPDCAVLPSINNLTDSTTFLDYHEYYLDDVHLLPTKDFPFKYISVKTGAACNGSPVLLAPVFSGASYQWYKDSIAIKNADAATYSVTDNSDLHYYNVMITLPEKCITSEPFLVTKSNLDKVHIPADTTFCSESKSILLSPALDGITYTINLIKADEVVINASGKYQVIASDINGCEKIFTTTVISENCSNCHLLLPTAFTPNSDGLNDIFKPQINCAVSKFHIIIFNRWGEKIFESFDINKGWNGFNKKDQILNGTYVYLVEYTTGSGVAQKVKGTIILLH